MITSKTIAYGIIKAIISLMVLFILCYFIFKIQTVIIYVFIALILTLITNPFVEFLKKRLRFSNSLAVVSTMFFIMMTLIGFIMMFIPLVISQSKNLSLINTHAIENNFTALVYKMNSFLESYNISSELLLEETQLTSKINFDFIGNFFNSILGTISSVGIGSASVLFITFFFLKDKVLFISGVKQSIPEKHEEKILNSIFKINELLSRYFIGLLIQLFIVFILYLTVLLIFGIENAMVIALICAILNIIPYVGPLIGSFLAAILTMISNINGDFRTEIIPTTLFVLFGFWIVQLIDNNISQPYIFSKSVNSHPLEIFLIILISGFLLGITGMIIAVPAYTILKVIAKEFFGQNKIIKIITKNI